MSVLTLTAISIDRYYAICHPLRFKSNLSQAKRIILLIWLVSLLLMAPDLVYLRAKESDDLREAGLDIVLYSDCNYDWSEQASRVFQFVKTILLYLIPFMLMFCAHFKIMRALQAASATSSASSPPLRQPNSAGLEPAGQQRRPPAPAPVPPSLASEGGRRWPTLVGQLQRQQRPSCSDSHSCKLVLSSELEQDKDEEDEEEEAKGGGGGGGRAKIARSISDLRNLSAANNVDLSQQLVETAGCGPPSHASSPGPAPPRSPTKRRARHRKARAARHGAAAQQQNNKAVGCLREAVASDAAALALAPAPAAAAKLQPLSSRCSSLIVQLPVHRNGLRAGGSERRLAPAGHAHFAGNQRLFGRPNLELQIGECPSSASSSLAAAANQQQQQQLIITMHNKSKLESRRKVAKMLMAIVALFGLCYLPVHLINFLR